LLLLLCRLAEGVSCLAKDPCRLRLVLLLEATERIGIHWLSLRLGENIAPLEGLSCRLLWLLLGLAKDTCCTCCHSSSA